jgi:hypothetical protein
MGSYMKVIVEPDGLVEDDFAAANDAPLCPLSPFRTAQRTANAVSVD